MPNLGDYVTVRARQSMPGVYEGQVLVVQWGPRLATLVARNRYELIEPARPQDPAAPAEPADEPTAAVAAPTNAAADGTAGDAPATAKRQRVR
jgi:hypothetical protein